MSRFIPVGTGNTIGLKKPSPLVAVHPRGHGEHHKTTVILCKSTGSSPWARGTPYESKDIDWPFRFIPVGTGNTFEATLLHVFTPVHPRGHGEHTLISFLLLPGDGSSPWARGTQSRQLAKYPRRRFIPVGTGNTSIYR